MSFGHEKLQAWTREGVKEITPHKAILYALGVGLGDAPTDPQQLRYLYEKNLSVLPTMAMVMGVHPDFIDDPEIGVDMVRMLHGESGCVLHKPLPVSGKVRARARVEQLIDRGAAKGAACYFATDLYDDESGDHLATNSACFILRGNGGFGGPDGPAPAPHPVPERAPDLTCDLPILPQAGLIYRLSGDTNPLHVDPDVARKAGFQQPIFHGLGTFGVAGHAVLKTLCDYDATRFRQMKLRYSAPVFPGETLRAAFFDEGHGQFAMRCTVLERDKVVLNNGYIKVA